MGKDLFHRDFDITGFGDHVKMIILAELDPLGLLFFKLPGNFFDIHDPGIFTGDSDDVNVLPPDVFFLQENIDGPGIAAFDDNCHGPVVRCFLPGFLPLFIHQETGEIMDTRTFPY